MKVEEAVRGMRVKYMGGHQDYNERLIGHIGIVNRVEDSPSILGTPVIRCDFSELGYPDWGCRPENLVLLEASNE